jgi:hypothetical protein
MKEANKGGSSFLPEAQKQSVPIRMEFSIYREVIFSYTPENGEFFSVSRFREVKADFGPLLPGENHLVD